MEKIVKFTLLIFVALVISIQACTNAEKEEKQKIEALREEVIAVHDEAMLYMQDIENLRRKLSKKLQSLDSADAIIAENAANEIQQLMKELKSADDAMMTWMREYTPRYTALKDSTSAAMKAFLDTEMEKIQDVKVEMEEAISHAKEAL